MWYPEGKICFPLVTVILKYSVGNEQNATLGKIKCIDNALTTYITPKGNTFAWCNNDNVIYGHIYLQYTDEEISTNQISVHLYRLFKYCPNHRFIALGCGQRAIIAIECFSVHVAEQIIDGDLLGDLSFGACMETKCCRVTKLYITTYSTLLYSLKKGLTDVFNGRQVVCQFLPGVHFRWATFCGTCLYNKQNKTKEKTKTKQTTSLLQTLKLHQLPHYFLILHCFLSLV